MERRARQREKLKKLRQEQRHTSSKWKAQSKVCVLDSHHGVILVTLYSRDRMVWRREKEQERNSQKWEMERRIFWCKSTTVKMRENQKKSQ